jgi:hypothetical protein
MIRIAAFAVTSALLACVAVPVVAATRADSSKPTYGTCQALAMNRGITINERLSSEHGPSPYQQFMVACLAGKAGGTPAQNSDRWAGCVRRRIGPESNEYRSSDAWWQTMVACLASGAR